MYFSWICGEGENAHSQSTRTVQGVDEINVDARGSQRGQTSEKQPARSKPHQTHPFRLFARCGRLRFALIKTLEFERIAHVSAVPLHPARQLYLAPLKQRARWEGARRTRLRKNSMQNKKTNRFSIQGRNFSRMQFAAEPANTVLESTSEAPCVRSDDASKVCHVCKHCKLFRTYIPARLARAAFHAPRRRTRPRRSPPPCARRRRRRRRRRPPSVRRVCRKMRGARS